MAKVRKNIILRGLSGDLGKQLRIRTGPISGRTNVSAIPEITRRHKDSPAQVAGVRVEITDEAGALLETGPAVRAVSQRWEYPLQRSHSGPLTVIVYATDLPGHVTQASASKKLP